MSIPAHGGGSRTISQSRSTPSARCRTPRATRDENCGPAEALIRQDRRPSCTSGNPFQNFMRPAFEGAKVQGTFPGEGQATIRLGAQLAVWDRLPVQGKKRSAPRGVPCHAGRARRSPVPFRPHRATAPGPARRRLLHGLERLTHGLGRANEPQMHLPVSPPGGSGLDGAFPGPGLRRRRAPPVVKGLDRYSSAPVFTASTAPSMVA